METPVTTTQNEFSIKSALIGGLLVGLAFILFGSVGGNGSIGDHSVSDISDAEPQQSEDFSTESYYGGKVNSRTNDAIRGFNSRPNTAPCPLWKRAVDAC